MQSFETPNYSENTIMPMGPPAYPAFRTTYLYRIMMLHLHSLQHRNLTSSLLFSSTSSLFLDESASENRKRGRVLRYKWYG
mmetsp:Transcript_19401/g.54065  ORF Transcript_19401/g.54065 Transcript_19401/m.54065 type:complete len:81 (+) Transcript_19401:459-701(+)